MYLKSTTRNLPSTKILKTKGKKSSNFYQNKDKYTWKCFYDYLKKEKVVTEYN